MNKPENRVEEIISDLLRGRRLKLRAGDAEEKAAITLAARLTAARQGQQRMHPAFRNRLEQALRSAPKEQWLTRRSALVAGFGLAAGAVAGGAIGRAMEASPAAPQPAGGTAINPISGRWVDVAAMSTWSKARASGWRRWRRRLRFPPRRHRHGGLLDLHPPSVRAVVERRRRPAGLPVPPGLVHAGRPSTDQNYPLPPLNTV